MNRQLTKAHIFLIVMNVGCFFSFNNSWGQSQNSSMGNGGVIKSLNIVKDFGADPTGKTNSHAAFEAAASYINKRRGFVDLLIPEGNYIVGNQLRNGKENNIVKGYMGYDVFSIEGCNEVAIHGNSSMKTIIKMTDGMKYGSFDADGKKPRNPEEYNWYHHRSESGFSMEKQYKYQAQIGHFFKISNCTNISLKGIEINGNANKYELGGNWADKGRQIDADGIFILRSSNLNFSDLNIAEMGRDGILILDPDTKDTANLKTHDIAFTNINIKYSGRNGISWCGGSNMTFINCTISFTGYGEIKSAPLAGIDIEPEGSVCKNGKFTNCNFFNNVNMALASDRGGRTVTDSYNMNFTNCKFVQSPTDSYVIYLTGKANAYVFNRCEFYGLTLNTVIARSDIESTTYQSCLFQDCYKGAKAFSDINSFLLLSAGTHTVIDNCTFNSNYIAAIAVRGENGKNCNEVSEASKTLIKNSTFNSYIAPCTGNNCPSNGSGYAWLTRFSNNTFNYGAFQYIIDERPGCTGTGNTDQGNGIVKKAWPTNTTLPKCQN